MSDSANKGWSSFMGALEVGNTRIPITEILVQSGKMLMWRNKMILLYDAYSSFKWSIWTDQKLRANGREMNDICNITTDGLHSRLFPGNETQTCLSSSTNRIEHCISEHGVF